MKNATTSTASSLFSQRRSARTSYVGRPVSCGRRDRHLDDAGTRAVQGDFQLDPTDPVFDLGLAGREHGRLDTAAELIDHHGNRAARQAPRAADFDRERQRLMRHRRPGGANRTDGGIARRSLLEPHRVNRGAERAEGLSGKVCRPRAREPTVADDDDGARALAFALQEARQGGTQIAVHREDGRFARIRRTRRRSRFGASGCQRDRLDATLPESEHGKPRIFELHAERAHGRGGSLSTSAVGRRNEEAPGLIDQHDDTRTHARSPNGDAHGPENRSDEECDAEQARHENDETVAFPDAQLERQHGERAERDDADGDDRDGPEVVRQSKAGSAHGWTRPRRRISAWAWTWSSL